MSLLFLNGMCCCLDASALMTSEREESDELIATCTRGDVSLGSTRQRNNTTSTTLADNVREGGVTVSLKRSPVAPLLLTRSLPARSMRLRVPSTVCPVTL